MANFYDVWFSNIDINNSSKLKIFETYKESKIIWELKYEDYKNLGIRDSTIIRILDESQKVKIEKYISYIEKNNIELVNCYDEKYPTSLKNIDNKPVFLYVRGEIKNLYKDSVAIVGARNASEYGKNIARKISKDIADKNIVIVSGLANGIDKYAHLGALDSIIGQTVAVLGTGVSNEEIYPYENKKLFERILENKGTVISEFKLGTKPERYNFPLRNRIISGLSNKIIVVEARRKSGSLITVDYALDQGKDVFAVPGNINSFNSEGTNFLISEGAKIYTKLDDIF